VLILNMCMIVIQVMNSYMNSYMNLYMNQGHNPP
jgi:hypothetical protein